MSLEQLPVHRWSDVSDQIALPPLPDGASISNGRGRPVRLPPIQTSPTSSSSRVASVSSSEQHDTITTLEEASASNVTRSIQHEGAEKEDDECVICLDELVAGKALFTAECGHRFHFSCLLENVNHDEANADKCPICRKPQTQWPEHTEGLVKAHPYCTNCGKRGTGGQFCDGCGQSLAHTPTAQERARAAAAAAAARSNVVVECPTCRIRCLVSTTARGTLQCPNGHLFQLRIPPSMMNSRINMYQQPTQGPRPIMRQCPSCYTRVQMPPGSQAGQYLCPHGHTFFYSPY